MDVLVVMLYNDNSARSEYYTVLSTYMSLLSAAPANKTAKITQKNRQDSKPETRQNPILFIFSPSSVRLML